MEQLSIHIKNNKQKPHLKLIWEGGRGALTHLMSVADPTGRNMLAQFQQEEVSINTLQFSRIEEEFLLAKP